MSQMPNNAEDLTANFQADVNDTAYTQNILNMDETFVKFDNHPSYTLNGGGHRQHKDIKGEHNDGIYADPSNIKQRG